MKRMTTRVVYNDEHCPFVISKEAVAWLKAKGFSGKFNDKDGVGFRLNVFAHGPAKDWFAILQRLTAQLHLLSGFAPILPRRSVSLRIPRRPARRP